MLHRVAFVAAFGKLVPASGNITHQQVRLGDHVHIRCNFSLAHSKPQCLFQSRLEPVVQLINADLQALVLVDERVAYQDTRHTRILARETKQ